MSRGRIILGLGGAALLAMAAPAAPARADGTTTLAGKSALVRGGAPLPQFNTSFPIEIGNPDPVSAARSDLEISLTTPDHNVLRFLFSPRSLAGETPGVGTTLGTNYAGVAWNLFDHDRMFGSVALSGAVNHALDNDPTSRLYGPLISLHSTFELGYAFDPRQSLSFDVDHANPAPYFGDRTTPAENLRLQYGYHF
ncbi:MAG TPA: hypothetical protein VNF99_02050 [Stellaceae bacterium]|nr:hypothetical protein [Stellaceae bacterium]